MKLDFELKSDIQKTIHAEQKVDPERDKAEIKQQVAKDFDRQPCNGYRAEDTDPTGNLS